MVELFSRVIANYNLEMILLQTSPKTMQNAMEEQSLLTVDLRSALVGMHQ